MRPNFITPEPPQKAFFDWAEARGKNWCAEMEFVYGAPDRGRHRAVFRAGDYVIKIPLNCYGVDDNEHEASLDSPILAECHLIHDEDGFPILIMERVLMLDCLENLPDWTTYVDGYQIGRSMKTGGLVAYDFGCH